MILAAACPAVPAIAASPSDIVVRRRMGLSPASGATDLKNSAYGVNAGAAALECRSVCVYPLQRRCHPFGDVFHIDRLQSRDPAAEHRIHREPAQQFQAGGEKSVVRPEHHCRAKENRIGECGPHRQLAFTSLSNVDRLRCRVRANSRHVDEPLDTRYVGLRCDAFGGLNVDGIKCVIGALDIETNRIDHTVGAGNCIGN